MAFNKRNRELSEARKATVLPPRVESVQRAGFVTGIPRGGSTPDNPGEGPGSGAFDRATMMDTLKQAYLTCTWSSACIDSISRTTTAGGVQCVPVSHSLDDPEIPNLPPEVAEVQDLLAYVNPYDDIRQMMRQVVADLMIFGDSYIEVTYFRGKPLGLWYLDPATMTIVANEHGTIKAYVQTTQTGRQVTFDPHEVIHVKFDSPGGGLYGTSPTQKNVLPIMSWLFTAALQKETMRKGDPPRIWVDWPLSLPPAEMERLDEQYHVRNLGAKNMGNLLQTKGDTTLKELSINALANWANALDQRRDEIMSGYGVPPSKIGVIEAGNLGGGTGTSQDKMLCLSTRIPTPAGWTTMGELGVGDTVLDEKGKPCKVTSTYDNPAADSWRIHFSDGTHIDACSDHLWVTWTARDRKAFGRNEDRVVGLPEDWVNWRSDDRIDGCGPEVRSTSEIICSLTVGKRNNHSIPVTGALDLPEVELPISPYTLGAWLGDGGSTTRQITVGVQDLEEMVSLLSEDGTSVTHRYRHENKAWQIFLGEPGEFVHRLKINDLHGNKHIPAEYLRASIDQRLALLQGLMDTDGGWTGGSQVVFVNMNERLADEVVELARSLGQKPVKAERLAKLNGISYGTAYRVTWTPTIQVFRLPRKAEQWTPSTHGMQCWMRSIVNVEKIPDKAMRCIRVDSPNSMYLAGDGMIPTHNTYMTNVIGPISELVMETFSFALLYQCYNVKDWRLQFGRVDWRDDITLEQIYDMRIRNGIFTLNRARSLVGEPTAVGGDDPIIVDRQNMVLWSDLKDLSKANVEAIQVQNAMTQAAATGASGQPGVGNAQTSMSPAVPAAPESNDLRQYLEATESLNAAWRKSYQGRRKQALKEMPRV